jgi:hypothetical protein
MEEADRESRRAWLWVLAAALLLAVISLLTNLNTQAELEGKADTWLAIRGSLSKIAKAGTLWAGIGVLAGWLVQRPLAAALAGIAATAVAIFGHYGLGIALGVFDGQVWADNRIWVLAPVIVGAPLGVIGALARRPALVGLLAGLVVPFGALTEPWVGGRWPWLGNAILPAPQRISDAVCAIVLTIFGLSLGSLVIRRNRRQGQAVALSGFCAQRERGHSGVVERTLWGRREDTLGSSKGQPVTSTRRLVLRGRDES